jgi:hypothetical protein
MTSATVLVVDGLISKYAPALFVLAPRTPKEFVLDPSTPTLFVLAPYTPM